MLRGDGFNIDGSPATSALNLVADTSERIVALVVNLIDETLKADTQARLHGLPMLSGRCASCSKRRPRRDVPC